MKLIITKIKEHLGLFLTAIFFLTVESLSDLLQPTLMSHIVDDGVKNQDVGTVLFFGGGWRSDPQQSFRPHLPADWKGAPLRAIPENPGLLF